MDKHSSGGVGDKTSFLVAPLAAACGVAVPMISGRALGHTGGTLDKLEAIPGYRTALTLAEFEAVIKKCGASIIGQTDQLAPADRKLYALRDRTGTVENPGLICASILSKKLAAGLDGLVLDVKTGSGAFLRKVEDAEFLAALMVATAEAAGTQTVALLTDMSQPLGRAAGNWIELVECVELLRGERPAWSEDLRELSLILAGWMIHLGGKAESAEDGYRWPPKQLWRMARRCGCFWKWLRRRAETCVFLTIPSAFTSRARRRLLQRGRAAMWRRWIRRRWAGRCSEPARDARKPASQSIRTREFCFMRGAARRWSAESRWRRCTRRRRRCWPSRWRS